MRFGEQLKLLREAQSLTQAELAEQVGLSRAAISLYEADTRVPRWDHVERIAQALGVTRSFFDQDDLWAEVEEALAQVKSCLISSRNKARTMAGNKRSGGSYEAGKDVPGAHSIPIRAVIRQGRALAGAR